MSLLQNYLKCATSSYENPFWSKYLFLKCYEIQNTIRSFVILKIVYLTNKIQKDLLFFDQKLNIDGALICKLFSTFCGDKKSFCVFCAKYEASKNKVSLKKKIFFSQNCITCK